MNKKVIAAGMAMVLASMGLTACGDSGSKEAKDSSDETYTVTMAYIGDKEEDTDRIEKKINEIMKKDINMELDIEPISWGAYAETMKLILSGGEKMDIVPILVEQVNSMVNAKQVIDMSEYIDKYGNNIKELLGDTAKAANIGNYVYGVTTGREWFCQSSVIMRKDILDECGIDVSSITDYKDLTDVYATVKEKYPEQADVMRELLTYDYYLRENAKSRPEFAGEDATDKRFVRAFYEEEEKERKHLPGYEQFDRNQMRKMTHLEYFPHMGKMLLFDYKFRNPLNQEARTCMIKKDSLERRG